jgi:hypothetical protein
MQLGSIGPTRTRVWLTAAIWMAAGVGFLWAFFAGGGPGNFPTDSLRHLAGAVALGLGFVGYWLVLWFTRQREGAPPSFDERDVAVVARANQVTLVVVLVGVFALAIGLWLEYEPAGEVPAGWMWLLAYGSVILAFVTSSVATLVLDRRTRGHG